MASLTGTPSVVREECGLRKQSYDPQSLFDERDVSKHE